MKLWDSSQNEHWVVMIDFHSMDPSCSVELDQEEVIVSWLPFLDDSNRDPQMFSKAWRCCSTETMNKTLQMNFEWIFFLGDASQLHWLLRDHLVATLRQILNVSFVFFPTATSIA